MKKLLLFFLLAIHTFSFSQKIQLIIFANTNDPDIGISCDKDKESVSVNLKTIASVLNYQVETKIYDGNNFSKRNLEDVMNNLQCNKDDIVFFYFSGHGGRAKNDDNKWPQMNFNKAGQYVDDYYVPLDIVNNIIRQHDPRLSIVIGDCCNNYANISPKVIMRGQTVVDDEETPNQVINKLFKDIKGNIIVSSSKQGEYSYSDSEKGGFFSSNYLLSFSKALNKEISGDWETVLETAKELTYKETERQVTTQTPQYEINVEYIHNPNPTPIIETDYITEINNLLNKNVNSAKRLKDAKLVMNKYFTKDAKVYTIAKNGKTVIDVENVLAFLYRIVYNKRIIKFVDIDKKERDNKIRVLYLHEIRKK